MNLNYVGSIAQERMRFRSTTEVAVSTKDDIFSAQTIFVPKSFAQDNIVDWEDGFLTQDQPAVFVAVVDNYVKIIKGDLLAQWLPIFRQDSNASVVLYVVVFDDNVGGGWSIGERSIEYAPLTKAFNALFSLSFFKHLFDPHYDGRDTLLPASAGAPAQMRLRLQNNSAGGTFATQDVVFSNTNVPDATEASIDVGITITNGTLPIGTYVFERNGFTFNLVLESEITEDTVGTFICAEAGFTDISFSSDEVIEVDTIVEGVTFTVASFTDGTNNASLTLSQGTYHYNDGVKLWNIDVPQNYQIPSGDVVLIRGVKATTVGLDSNLSDATRIDDLFLGLQVPDGIQAVSSNIYQGLNPGVGVPVVIDTGEYRYRTEGKDYILSISEPITIAVGAVSQQLTAIASTAGIDSSLDGLELNPSGFDPRLPDTVDALLLGVVQGSEPVADAVYVPSKYFDLSLALAQLCKSNSALSWFWSLVKISYDERRPNISDKCWIRYASRAEQLSQATSLAGGMRDRYYWGMLYLLGAENTTVIVHSEDENIIVDVFAQWYAQKNSSGTFIGNKLSLLRLGGTRIKPLGWPSWLDESINENDAEGHEQLRDMNVGYLSTIAGDTPQECCLSMARGVGDIDRGLPVTMQAIARFCDYTCAQEAAKMITDKGTLVDPKLTDDDAYQQIQRLVKQTLNRFAGTDGRLYNVMLRFPSFDEAKVSRTALSAASSWKAWYKDDLDDVEVSGGIVAE